MALETRQVRAGARLGQRPGLPVLAADDGQHVALDLVGCRDLVELAWSPVDDCEAEPVRRLARLLLEGDLAEHRQVATTERLGHVELREPLRPRLASELVERGGIDLVRLDDRRLERVHLLLEEAAHTLLQLEDLGGELGDDHDVASCFVKRRLAPNIGARH